MAERLIAPVLKTGDGETRSGVRIPLPPLEAVSSPLSAVFFPPDSSRLDEELTANSREPTAIFPAACPILPGHFLPNFGWTTKANLLYRRSLEEMVLERSNLGLR